MFILELKEIYKSYLKEPVLKGISFKILEKSITGVIGPNGAGKSTLFRIITGFEFPERGKVFIKGKEVKNFNERKNFISYMPEELKLYPEYYVYEFLNFFHKITKNSDEELIFSLSLKDIYDKKIKYLSKGWHQRLKLYTALATKKPLIILDEPFDGFDPLQMREIIKLIKKRNSEGFSFLLSIHQLSNAQKICNHFILIDDGMLVEEGNFEELSKKYSQNSLEEIFLKALER